MKTIMNAMKAMFVALAAAVSFAAQADTWEDPVTGVELTYTVFNSYDTGWKDTIKIGDGTNPAISTDTAGDIAIPAEIDGKPVTEINSYAFKDCTSLRSIVIPASVAYVYPNAFENCASLAYARILGDSVWFGEYVFRGCASLACFAFPSNTATISWGLFKDCGALESVAIHKSAVNVNGSPFSTTDNLKTVFIDADDSEERVRGLVKTGGLNLEYVTFVKGTARLVAFDAKGGITTNAVARLVLDGAAVGALPDSVQKSGYLFDGWFTAPEDGDPVTAETVVSGDVTYYAHWSVKPLPTTCTVTFNPNGGTIDAADATRVVDGGAELGALPEPEYEGHRFDGWFTLATGGDQVSAETVMIDETAEFFAHWTVVHTITLDPNYGTVTPSVLKVPHGEPVGDLPVPVRDGYTFGCWKLPIYGGAAETNTIINADATWKAYWAIGVYDKETIDGIEWSWRIYAGNADISGINRYGDPASAIPTATAGDIAIPSEFGTYQVKSIANYAFRYCSKVTSVTIPEGVESIEAEAFRDCTSLTNVVIPASVKIIWTDAFRGCTKLADENGFIIVRNILFQYLGSAAEVELPEGVEIIGSNAFLSNNTLANVAIPSTVTNIDNSAFRYCTNLVSVTIPQGVMSMGYYSFDNCSSLTTITIPRSVTSIGSYSFRGTKLATVMVENGDTDRMRDMIVKSGYDVSGVAFVEEDPWTVTFDANGGTVTPDTRPVANGAKVGPLPTPEQEGYQFNGWWTAADGGLAVSQESVITTNVTFYAHWMRIYRQVGFNANGGHGSIVTNVAHGAAVGEVLAELPVPTNDDVPFLGWFTKTAGGVPVTTGTVVTANCTYYAHWLPEGYSLFTDDDGVKWVYCATNNASTDYTDAVIIGDGENAAVTADAAGDITVPAEIDGCPVIRIADNAFRDFGAVTSVTIPEGVAYMGENVFRDCASLATVALPEGMSDIGAAAFDGCSSLRSVEIPSPVTTLPWSLFRNCSNLEEVAIPPSVITIDTQAFLNTALATVHVAIDDTERVSGLIAKSGFDVTGLKFVEDIAVPCTVTFDPNGGSIDDADATRIVNKKGAVGELPEATLEGYALVGWFTEPEGSEQISSETVITSNVTYYAHWTYPTETVDGVTWMYHIVDGGAEICSPAAWTSAISTNTEGAVAIPATLGGYPVTSIGSNAFIHCKLVTNVEIPESVSTIGYYAFAACGLTDVVIPANVTDLATCAFRQCKSLTNVTMSAGLKVIGNSAFSYCDKLEQVVLPEGLERIESGAFNCCEGLASVSVPDSVTYIGPRAFCECFALADENDMVIVNGILFDFSRDAQHNLTSVTIPGTVKVISDYAGRDFDKLEDLTISDGVTSIGVGGFTKSPLLSTLTVPASLTSIGTDAFKNTALATVHYLGSDAEKDRVSAMLAASGYDVSGVEFVCDWDPATILIGTADEYTADDDGSFDLALGALILSKDPPTVTLKGLPAGIKYTTKPGILAGKATKPGSYTVTVSAKSKSVKTPVTKDFTLVVPNLKDDAIPVADSYREMVPGVGYKVTIPEAADCKVTGLPAGMKWTAKAVNDKALGDIPANSVYGAPTKPGSYTVYFTKTTKEANDQGKTVNVKHTATSTFTVGPFPVLTVEYAGDGTGKVTGAGPYAANKKVTLKATADTKDAAATDKKPATVKSVFMGWYDGEELLSQSASYALVMPDADMTLTARFITAAEDAAGVSADVGDFAGFDAENTVADKTIPAGVHLSWPVSVEALTPATVKVAGLPSGLKFTAKPVTSKIGTGKDAVIVTNVPANTIYGVPTAASKKDKNGKTVPSQVKVTVTTSGKTAVNYILNVTVDPVKDFALGTFNGGGASGQATLTVAANGKISGKYLAGGLAWTVSAANFDSYDEDSEEYVATVTMKSGKQTEEHLLAVRAGEVNGKAVIGDGDTAIAELLKTDWKAVAWKDAAKPFAKAPALEYEARDAAGNEGTVTLKFASSGAVTARGAFATAVSGTATLIPVTEINAETGDFNCIVVVYFPPKTGKFDGYVESVLLRWNKAAGKFEEVKE